MKAISPVRPQRDSGPPGPPGTGSDLALRCVSEHSLHIARCRMQEEQQEKEEVVEEEERYRHGDMKECYSRLRRLVPSIPQDRRVSRVEILQHVIDYILDLQLALETHPALGRPPQTQRTPNPARTPLTVLNMDHQRTSIVKKPEDSILCR